MPIRVDDDPQQEDIERFGGDTRKCPKCKAEIYEDAEWCHKCGEVLGGSDAPSTIKPWQIITVFSVIGAIVVLKLSGVW
jgi:hypothetical protein